MSTASNLLGWAPFFRRRSSSRAAGNLSTSSARSKAEPTHDGDVIEDRKLN